MTDTNGFGTWQFSPSLGEERVRALSAAPKFAEITERIANTVVVLCCHRQECDDDRDFSRAVCSLTIPQSLFDLFFNSVHGYRGSYYASPFVGIEANHNFICRLLPLIVSLTDINSDGLTSAFAKESLTSLSAKVWLAEVGLGLCRHCEGEWSPPADEAAEILNGRWNIEPSIYGRWGRKAPYYSKLRLIGGFLNARYDEYIPACKRRRAQTLHWSGWA
jgi:hypothetical protein